MPGGGRRWKTLVSRYSEVHLDIEFPTVVHRPWKSLRDSHIPTAPRMGSLANPKIQSKEPGIMPDLSSALQAHSWIRKCSETGPGRSIFQSKDDPETG